MKKSFYEFIEESKVLRTIKNKVGTWFPFIGVTSICGLVLLSVYQFTYNRSAVKAEIIERDLGEVAAVLEKIDHSCGIISIKHERNYIDFLTVKEFVGSQIGCLNLTYPHKWSGPFAAENPTIQGIFYELVQAHDGLYLVPGNGVQLPNGSIMGKDIIISKKTEVAPLLKNVLNDKGRALARKIILMHGATGESSLTDEKNPEQVSAAIENIAAQE